MSKEEVQSYTRVEMVCACGNNAQVINGDQQMFKPARYFTVDRCLDYICGICGELMKRKIIVTSVTETETEVKEKSDE